MEIEKSLFAVKAALALGSAGFICFALDCLATSLGAL